MRLLDDLAARLEPPRTRRILLVVAALLAVGIGANAVRRALRGRGSRYDETTGYSHELVVQRLNVYEIHPKSATHTKYPPFFFVFVTPFALLPTALGASLWFLLNLAAAVGGVLLAVRAVAVGAPRPPPWTTALLVGALSALLVGTNLSTAQVNLLIVFLVVLGLHEAAHERDDRAGFALAVATMLKLTPALLLAWLVLRGRWRVLRGAVLGTLACLALSTVVLGPARHLEVTRSWLEVVVPYSRLGALGEGIGGVRHTNQSLAAALHRFLTDVPAGGGIEGLQVNVARLPAATIEVVVKLLSGLLVVLVAAACGRGPVPPGSRRAALEAGLVVILTLVISPVSWINHFAALVWPWAIAVECVRVRPPGDPQARGTARRVLAAWLLVASSVWILLMAFSLPLIGALLLGATLVALHRRERAEAGAAPAP